MGFKEHYQEHEKTALRMRENIFQKNICRYMSDKDLVSRILLKLRVFKYSYNSTKKSKITQLKRVQKGVNWDFSKEDMANKQIRKCST